MKKNLFIYNSQKSGLFFLWTILMILLSLGNCKSIDVKDKPDLLPYILKPVAILPTKSPRNLESVWPDLMYKMEQNLRNMPNLGRITGIKEIKKKLDANPILRSAYKTYISTFTLTGISDKEIALRLKDEFGSPHFIILDFVSYPCTKECPSDEQWIIRLKLLEVSTGEIIFRARTSHQLDQEEQNTKLYQDLAAKMIADVVAEFKAGFIIPWHRWRFENIKKISELKPRSEMGI